MYLTHNVIYRVKVRVSNENNHFFFTKYFEVSTYINLLKSHNAFLKFLTCTWIIDSW